MARFHILKPLWMLFFQHFCSLIRRFLLIFSRICRLIFGRWWHILVSHDILDGLACEIEKGLESCLIERYFWWWFFDCKSLLDPKRIRFGGIYNFFDNSSEFFFILRVPFLDNRLELLFFAYFIVSILNCLWISHSLYQLLLHLIQGECDLLFYTCYRIGD